MPGRSSCGPLRGPERGHPADDAAAAGRQVATPSLTVDDLDNMVRRLHGQGVQFDAEEEGADEGYRLVRVRDPEGNPIGLTA